MSQIIVDNGKAKVTVVTKQSIAAKQGVAGAGVAGVGFANTREGASYVPSFTKYANNPIFSEADTSLGGGEFGVSWPWVQKVAGLISSPINSYYMWFSTDHDPGAGGVGLATAPSPVGPWTDQGMVYVDDEVGFQTETPSVIWNEATDEFFMYYHQIGTGGITIQATVLAKSPDGVNWTRHGVVADESLNPFAEVPPQPHTGYFHPFRIHGQWYAYSLLNGGTYPRFALWFSRDGTSWVRDARPLGWQMDRMQEVNPLFRFAWSLSTVAEWRGRLWWIGLIVNSGSGGAVVNRRVCAAPIAPTLRNTLGPPLPLWETTQPWENNNIRTLTVFSDAGKLYVYYQIDQNIGVAVSN